MKDKKITFNFLIKLSLILLFISLSFLLVNLANATDDVIEQLSCEDKYPDDGHCVETEECPEGEFLDSEAVCDVGKCCHKYGAQIDLDLQVPIFKYEKAVNIADYIKNIYKYALYILVPIAIVMVIFGGVKWILAGGNVAQIKTAKKYISSAFIGLIIGVLSYIILSFIGLTQLETPQVAYVEEIESPDIDAPLFGNWERYVPGAIFCPKNGGASVMEQITRATVGKVTYRFGGKGGPPPYSEIRSQYMQYNNFCPSGTVCLDCSGYINFVLRCAGISSYGGGTTSIFGCNCSNSERIENFGATSVNGIGLKAGDVVGYPTGCGHGIGHVYIYAGGGKLFESHGGHSGRSPGNAIRVTNFSGHNWTASGKPKCIRRIQ